MRTVGRKPKRVSVDPTIEYKQSRSVEEFSGAMLHQLRLQPEFFDWEPTDEEMLMALAKTFELIKQARAREDRRSAQVASADLGNLAMKCFSHYARKD